MQRLITFGDMVIDFDSNTGWYYVKHATTDKLICKTRSKSMADSIASSHSDYKGNPLRDDNWDSFKESTNEPYYCYEKF